MSVKRAPQQINTAVWAAGPQDVGISSHDDDGASWVAVRVGQVLTYAHGVTAPESVSLIWAEAEVRAAEPAAAGHGHPPPIANGPGIVVHVRGDQSSAGRIGRHDDAFPYDGRTGCGHIVIGGSCGARSTATPSPASPPPGAGPPSSPAPSKPPPRAGRPRPLPPGPVTRPLTHIRSQLSTFGVSHSHPTTRAGHDHHQPSQHEGNPTCTASRRPPASTSTSRPRPTPSTSSTRTCATSSSPPRPPVHIEWTITPPTGPAVRGWASTPGTDPTIEANLDALHNGLVEDFAIALYEASRVPQTGR